MKIAATGFISGDAGSGASADGLIIQELLRRGHQVHFFSKPSFVDPRPLMKWFSGFHFVETVNDGPDLIRRRVQGVPVARCLTERLDSATYNRLLVRTISKHHERENFASCVWFGDYVRGRIQGLKGVSCHAPVPGCDARSIFRRYAEVKRLAGNGRALKWMILAQLRLWALPDLTLADHTIVASQWSQKGMEALGVSRERLSTLPLPIDLQMFSMDLSEPLEPSEELRACWVGRIVPRKRLDLFLAGAAMAIRKGLNLKLTIAGIPKLVSGYERLIRAFPFPDRLEWKKNVPRGQVPDILRRNDVLALTSEEEDFASGPAEMKACGGRVIVRGPDVSGNADYASLEDIVLKDDQPETLCSAFMQMHRRRYIPSSWWARQIFSVDSIASRLIATLSSMP